MEKIVAFAHRRLSTNCELVDLRFRFVGGLVDAAKFLAQRLHRSASEIGFDRVLLLFEFVLFLENRDLLVKAA
jgi:hypothetical protein